MRVGGRCHWLPPPGGRVHHRGLMKARGRKIPRLRQVAARLQRNRHQIKSGLHQIMVRRCQQDHEARSPRIQSNPVSAGFCFNHWRHCEVL
jgi:hypothetical protein